MAIEYNGTSPLILKKLEAELLQMERDLEGLVLIEKAISTENYDEYLHMIRCQKNKIKSQKDRVEEGQKEIMRRELQKNLLDQARRAMTGETIN